MGKIKINLTSGAIVEKPLICAFKASDNEYVVLDDEMNGSMGLPIILVCKYVDNKLTKILDQSEWQTVKEYLKNIIAGGQLEFIKMGNELQADDIYYTQLTLPVPSFDALKGAYKVEETPTPVAPVSPAPVVETPAVATPAETPVPAPSEVASTPSVSEPVKEENKNLEETGILDLNLNNIPTPDSTPAPSNTPTPAVEPASEGPGVVGGVGEQGEPATTPEVNEPAAPTTSTAPVPPATEEVSTAPTENTVPTPPEPAPVATPESTPAAPTPTVATENVIPSIEPIITPQVEATPVAPTTEEVKVTEINPSPASPAPVEPAAMTTPESKFKDQKEAFMQACENMFDALVQKFERELENNKQN